MCLFCVYIWMMVLLKYKQEEIYVEKSVRISFYILYANYFKLSRAVDCFLFLGFYGALTLQSVVILPWSLLKVYLRK